jgi:hypothetical protein
MHKNQRVSKMAVEVLAPQASAHAKQTGESFEDALESVLETEAGRQLGKLCDGGTPIGPGLQQSEGPSGKGGKTKGPNGSVVRE